MTKSMKPETIALLNRMNLDFYQRLAPSFSATRQRVQNGVMRMADVLPDVVNVLDVGCGNGNFSVELAKRGKKGHYLGIDFSAPLLAESEEMGEDGLWTCCKKVGMLDLRVALFHR
jgi:ubiquinone/menaquinone biosynthesis C-methylase UbiE